MRYTRQVLQPGEEVIAVGKFHWLYSVAAYLWLVVFGVFLIGIIIFFAMMIRKWTTEIVVTTDRLIYKTGWIAGRAEEIALTRIEEVTLSQTVQTVMGRIFGYGSLRISGTGTSVLRLPSILSNPVEFRRALAECRMCTSSASHSRRSSPSQSHRDDTRLSQASEYALTTSHTLRLNCFSGWAKSCDSRGG